jgi:hypothetical protein
VKFLDFRRALTQKIKTLGYEVRYDNINKGARTCFFIDLIDYQKEFNSNYREFKKLDFDIIYIPKKQEGNTTEIYSALEDLDNNFEVTGNKILVVTDEQGEKRHLTMKNVMMHEVDELGHYQFSIELYDRYGKLIDYELMQELHLNFNKGDDE